MSGRNAQTMHLTEEEFRAVQSVIRNLHVTEADLVNLRFAPKDGVSVNAKTLKAASAARLNAAHAHIRSHMPSTDDETGAEEHLELAKRALETTYPDDYDIDSVTKAAGHLLHSLAKSEVADDDSSLD
jgi:hypothetical protein